MDDKENIKEIAKSIAIHEAKSLFYKAKLATIVIKKGSIAIKNTAKSINKKIRKK